METLEARLGYTFQDRSLLQQALTHSSYANENRGGLGSNERLEFLGDSILGMVTADHLYHAHPDLPEGDLTRTRAALVCEESLVEVADRLELGKFLRLGRGEAAGGGPLFGRTQWRRCWRRFIWTEDLRRPGKSFSGSFWPERPKRP